MSRLQVHNDELTTMREAARDLPRKLEALERGDVEKLVVTQRSKMRAVVVSVDRYAEIERQLGRAA